MDFSICTKIKSHFFRRHVRRKKYLDPGKCRPQGGMQPGFYSVEKLVFRQSALLLPLSEGRLFLPTAEKEIMPKSEQSKRIILTENG